MLENVFDTIIIGGGLSGLYAGYLLSEQSRSFVILEARKRTGGRILCPEYNRFFSDLGPSWYWPAINPSLAGLIQTLGLEGYRQSEDGLGRFEDPNGNIHTVRGYSTSPASFRLNGGMNALIKKLYERIPETAVKLDSPVCEIKKQEDGVHVHVGELEKAPRAIFKTQKIILALPPRLAAATILFTPDLPHRLEQAMLRIGTWMAGQAKFYALYDTPFWRDAGFSGQAF
ncbi:MAG: FAD-dependent oxidoreductase, partial [Proteobacteria bacterium]|nr:FAD-dependent oxidoreductase [Pseudomonadota bacterium]